MKKTALLWLLAAAVFAPGSAEPTASGLSQALTAAYQESQARSATWPTRSDGSGLDNVLTRGSLRLGYVDTRNPQGVELVTRIGRHYGVPDLRTVWVQSQDQVAGLKRDRFDLSLTGPHPAMASGPLGYTLPGGYATSELSEVMSAALREFTDQPGRYADLYEKYLGVRREAPTEGPPGRWIDKPTPGSTLDLVLQARKLRYGFWRHAPYQFTQDGREVGFERELGNALLEILARHYPGLQGEWLEQEFLSDGKGQENILLFDKLASDLIAGKFDVLLSGIIQRPERPVAVAAPDLKFFWTAVYTGKDNLDLKTVQNTDRATFVKWLIAHPGCSLISTPGGPSQDTVEKLVADVQKGGGKVTGTTLTVPEMIKANSERSVHFIVGDAIALSDMAKKQGLNLNIELRGGEWMAPMTALDP